MGGKKMISHLSTKVSQLKCVGKSRKCKNSPHFLIGLYGFLTANPICKDCIKKATFDFSIPISEIRGHTPQELKRILGSNYRDTV